MSETFLLFLCNKVQDIGRETKKERKRKRETERELTENASLLFSFSFSFVLSEWGWHGYYCAAYFSKTTAPISAERQLPVTPCAKTAPRPRRIRRYQVHTRIYSSAYCRMVFPFLAFPCRADGNSRRR